MGRGEREDFVWQGTSNGLFQYRQPGTSQCGCKSGLLIICADGDCQPCNLYAPASESCRGDVQTGHFHYSGARAAASIVGGG